MTKVLFLTMILSLSSASIAQIPEMQQDCIKRPPRTEDSSIAAPRDGASFAVGEPVSFGVDEEFATGMFCPPTNEPYRRSKAVIERRIIHSKVGALIQSGNDIADVISFNIPGTITVERHAASPEFGRVSKHNSITIDGAEQPEPQQDSNGPQIAVTIWLGKHGGVPRGPELATLDNSFTDLAAYKVMNTGNKPLVLHDVYMAADQGISKIEPIDFEKETTIAPGDHIILDFKETILDPGRYMELAREDRILESIIHSNDDESTYYLLATGADVIFPTKSAIPEDQEFPPEPPTQ